MDNMLNEILVKKEELRNDPASDIGGKMGFTIITLEKSMIIEEKSLSYVGKKVYDIYTKVTGPASRLLLKDEDFDNIFDKIYNYNSKSSNGLLLLPDEQLMEYDDVNIEIFKNLLNILSFRNQQIFFIMFLYQGNSRIRIYPKDIENNKQIEEAFIKFIIKNQLLKKPFLEIYKNHLENVEGYSQEYIKFLLDLARSKIETALSHSSYSESSAASGSGPPHGSRNHRVALPNGVGGSGSKSSQYHTTSNKTSGATKEFIIFNNSKMPKPASKKSLLPSKTQNGRGAKVSSFVKGNRVGVEPPAPPPRPSSSRSPSNPAPPSSPPSASPRSPSPPSWDINKTDEHIAKKIVRQIITNPKFYHIYYKPGSKKFKTFKHLLSLLNPNDQERFFSKFETNNDDQEERFFSKFVTNHENKLSQYKIFFNTNKLLKEPFIRMYAKYIENLFPDDKNFKKKMVNLMKERINF